jgi:hypothetical protein
MSSAAAASAGAIIQATRAFGVIVRIDPADFLALVEQAPEPLVVHAPGGFFAAGHHYLASHRGIVFVVRTRQQLRLPHHCQVVEAKRIWLPV